MRWTRLDGGFLGFDRDTGLNALWANERTRTLRRAAPRTLQVGLLTPCNLACSFCYRDLEAPSRLTKDFLVELLTRAADWGVLEVAFGGGEPLLFKGFADLLDELHQKTPLGLNFTTNGMLLTPELVARFDGKVGEIRLSAYPDNDWRGTLARYPGAPIGTNWIVTPANVREVVTQVREFFALGAQNVLLLGYKGPDVSMQLGPESMDLLRGAIRELDGLPLMLDICLYPLLSDLPHLFARTDCGAGDDMLSITADRAVQACSFSDRRIPFESLEELQQIYAWMRAAKPHANVGGCTRDRFDHDTTRRVVSGRVLPILVDEAASGAWLWQGRASSNSGPYTLIASFRTEEEAKKLEEELDDAYQAHLDWVVDHPDELMENYYAPTPPLLELGARYGFEWPKDNGFAWEGDAFGDRAEADVLDIERLGPNVIVHAPYAQEIGQQGIEHIAATLGATSIVPIGDDFRFVVRAKDQATQQTLADRFERALAELDQGYIGHDSDDPDSAPLEDCPYRVEVELATGTRRLGFDANIGGYVDASRLVIGIAGAKNCEYEIHGGRSPEKLPSTGG